MSASEADLMAFLDSLAITTRTVRHHAHNTVEEAQAGRKDMPGVHCKNLYLRDKKKRQVLVIMDEDRQVNLVALAKALGYTRFSFGSGDRLYAALGIRPGSVTPFALINARVPVGDEPDLTVVLDAGMLAGETLWYHPLHNEATTAITSPDLQKFIRACGYDPVIFDFDASL